MRLSVVVPCFNEADNIAHVVSQATEVGRAICSALEVIVVNDGSTDRTREVLEVLQEDVPELVAVHHDCNRGYGAAVRTGLDRAHHDYVFLTDGDGQFDLRELRQAVHLLQEHDMVVGYRSSRRDGYLRSLWGRIWTALVNVLLGLRVRDANCAFKLLPRRLLRAAPLSSDGALISAELLFQARKSRLRIAQWPVSHYPRRAGRQSGASLRVVVLACAELCAFVTRRRSARLQADEPGAPVG
jgi:glycosyltransferase involved in cell wall biosynthesis